MEGGAKQDQKIGAVKTETKQLLTDIDEDKENVMATPSTWVYLIQ